MGTMGEKYPGIATGAGVDPDYVFLWDTCFKELKYVQPHKVHVIFIGPDRPHELLPPGGAPRNNNHQYKGLYPLRGFLTSRHTSSAVC